MILVVMVNEVGQKQQKLAGRSWFLYFSEVLYRGRSIEIVFNIGQCILDFGLLLFWHRQNYS